MEYLLKLRERKEKLSEEIKIGLEEEYALQCEVVKGTGEVRILGLDVSVLGFTVRDIRSGNCATCIAVGYEDAQSAKYRVYGNVEPYCPKCNLGFAFDSAGQYCSHCGTKIEYRI